ncbi:hypothetical protein KSZ_58830 [Dictyobacter formicarum]|uniref:Secreted protein n=1 Tax=Dictyobacter formicarum TaxID=2778368 RepID=A0ABQ3VPU8_9CHLR|nr:hypothetical protein KSZ_58830 [Dictyobacter formicarum]
MRTLAIAWSLQATPLPHASRALEEKRGRARGQAGASPAPTTTMVALAKIGRTLDVSLSFDIVKRLLL